MSNDMISKSHHEEYFLLIEESDFISHSAIPELRQSTLVN